MYKHIYIDIEKGDHVRLKRQKKLFYIYEFFLSVYRSDQILFFFIFLYGFSDCLLSD